MIIKVSPYLFDSFKQVDWWKDKKNILAIIVRSRTHALTAEISRLLRCFYYSGVIFSKRY